MKILVLGIGNTLLSDEGVGIHVLHALSAGEPLPDEVELLDGGTLSFTLAGPIQDADALIVVDAANINALPGSWQLAADAKRCHGCLFAGQPQIDRA